MKELRSLISQHGTQKNPLKLKGCLNHAVWEQDSLHELPSDFSFMKRFTVRETTSSWNLFRKRTTQTSKGEGRSWGSDFTEVQKAHLGFATCVPLIVFAAEGMLSGCWAEFASETTCFTSNVTGQKQSNPRLDWTKRMHGCWLRVSPLLPHCLWHWLFLISPYPTEAELPAGMHI